MAVQRTQYEKTYLTVEIIAKLELHTYNTNKHKIN